MRKTTLNKLPCEYTRTPFELKCAGGNQYTMDGKLNHLSFYTSLALSFILITKPSKPSNTVGERFLCFKTCVLYIVEISVARTRFILQEMSSLNSTRFLL